ncbi:MAG: LysM peptidoglycan-binding domain-containing protein [Candidatus Moranbacteria bacterium]|nr:LysM peptidoglycan-binding domain-containing protein [Candidatus Moranbacteria bacterium]
MYQLKGESLIGTQSKFTSLWRRFRASGQKARHTFSHTGKGEESVETHIKHIKWQTRVHQWQTKFLLFLKEASGYRVVRIFRNYSAFSIVASSALLVSASNFAQGKDFDSLLFGYAGKQVVSEDSAIAKRRIVAQVDQKDNLSLVPLASAPTAVDPEERDNTSLFDAQGGNTNDPLMLSSWSGSYPKESEENEDVKIYTVASGDTVSGIAAKFGITVSTILWANDIDNVDQIKPDDQIFILPVAGLSHTVVASDTLDALAAKYKADKEKIISFNSLPANGELRVGDSIIIPDGQKETPVRQETPSSGLERRQYATSTGGTATDISSGYRTLGGKPGTGHRFPFGWCTWYVSQKRYVPWSGNAGTWLYKAKALGYKTGRKPTVGSIMVTTEDRRYGHVAYVEKVSGDTITVSEMNYVKWGKTNRRTLSASSRAIKGFIY